jgi:hypothetical protein
MEAMPIIRVLIFIHSFMSSIFDDLLLKSLRATSKPISIAGGYPVAACFREINLVEIPNIMRKRKLTKAAALMEHWFVGQPFAMPQTWKAPPPLAIDPRTISQDHVEESIVTMQWVLGFERAFTMQQELRAAVLGHLGERSLNASQAELFESLASDRKFTNRTEQFGIGSARTLHKTAHVNTRIVSANNMDKFSDPLDDLYCSLGVFGLHVVAAGTVSPIDPKNPKAGHHVTIVKFGYYIKDTYDFNDNQPLGLWDEDGVSKIVMPRRVLVENADFRKWRAVFRHGGDFMVFSDIAWVGLPKPLVWKYQGGF